MERHLGSNFLTQSHHAQILHDEGIHTGLCGSGNGLCGGGKLPIPYQGIQGQVDLYTPNVAVGHSFGKLLEGEISGIAAGIKALYA